MKLAALTPREASIFACFVDTVVAPRSVLPAVRETDAVAFFDHWLTRMPPVNRLSMRALLYLAEIGPFAAGFRHRLRALDASRRAQWLESLDRLRPPTLRFVAQALKASAQLAYYGSEPVMRQLGYDADANVERGRMLRATEGRP